MRRQAYLLLAVLWFLLGLLVPESRAQAPEKHPAMAYRGWLYDGLQYRELFAPEQVDTLYVLAGEPVALSAHRTLVYYWPLTARYMADWENMDETLPGRLEISPASQEGATLEVTPFSLVHPEVDTPTPRITLVTGGEAERQYARYQTEMADYWRRMDQYNQDAAAYEEEMREAIKAVGAGQKNVPVPTAPTQPLEPQLYVTEPAPGYVFTLQEGRYTIQLRGPDGQIVSGSRRQVVAFQARRQGSSYTIIPADQWTRPQSSNAPEDTLYLTKGSVLYFQPRAVREYRESYYLRLKDPQDTSGRDDRWVWVQQELLAGGRLEVCRGGRPVLSVSEKPYFVEQLPGAALGYNILEYDPQEMAGEKPTFHGYRVAVDDAPGGLVQVRFRDAQGNLVPGSERDVRLLSGRPAVQLYLPALLPLLLAGVLSVRRRAQRRREELISTQEG